jgi:hypothetical protein
MSLTITQKLVGAAATAVAAGGFLAVPAAHADTTCTVPGSARTGWPLYLHQTNGYDLTIQADAGGSKLGPSGSVVFTNEQGSREQGASGSVSGAIAGRAIDFTITWENNQGQAHFTGTVGDDGIAHGTSTGPPVPDNLWEPGQWGSTNRLTCT